MKEESSTVSTYQLKLNNIDAQNFSYTNDNNTFLLD